MPRLVKYDSWFLGVAIFAFGFLKLFEPFNGWFHAQIATSGLPPLAIPLGIAAEMAIGLGLVLPLVAFERLGVLSRPLLMLASVALIANMAVATWVHLQPEVPPSVLPLGVKPPVLPLTFAVLAGLNLLLVGRAHFQRMATRK